MIVSEKEIAKMPEHLRELFVKLHNPGSDEVMSAFAAFGETKKPNGRPNCAGKTYSKAADVYGEYQADAYSGGYMDTGTAARFFYSAKASAADRAGSKHPTVKPIALMRWLTRLVTPPGGTILDPFAGSGTTLQAAHECGFNAIGCEQSAEYVADIERRIADMTVAIETQPVSAQPDLFAA